MRVPTLAFACLLTAPPLGGCILDNPAFDDGLGVLSTASEGSAETEAASYGASLGDTASDVTSASGSAGESDGTTSEGSTDTGLTSDASTADTGSSDSSDSTTDGSGGSDSSDSDSDSGEPASVELKNYVDGTCSSTFWCKQGGVPAVNLPVECFDSPLEPPYVVDQVGFQVYATLGAAPTELQIYEFDENTQQPVYTPIAEEWFGLIDGAGEHSVNIDPVVISTPKVCVGLLSGDADTQLGIATNGMMPPPRRSFLGGDSEGPYCQVPTHTDVLSVGPGAGTWCMSARVRDE